MTTARYFNPRTPCGVRQNLALLCRLLSTFQSTHPMRGATSGREISIHGVLISIHAPHAGCDGEEKDDIIEKIKISIHAPHAGCDRILLTIWTSKRSFQSTHPMRGATKEFLHSLWNNPNFNPRTPCGVRHDIRDVVRAIKEQFQSTHPMRGATRPASSAITR